MALWVRFAYAGRVGIGTVEGDTIALRAGQIYLNGKPVKQEAQPNLILPVDANNPCND